MTATMDASGTIATEMPSLLPSSTTDGAFSSSNSGVMDTTTAVFSSYDQEQSASTQFPMQHATQPLPSNQVPLTTTDPISLTQHSVLSTSTSGTQTYGLSSLTDSISKSVTKSISDSIDNKSVIVTPSTKDQILTDSTFISSDLISDSVSSSSVSSINPSSTIGAVIDNVEPTDQSGTIDPSGTLVNSDILTSSSTEYSGYLYGTPTPSEKILSSATIGLDSVSLRTTDAVPLPPVSGKPLIPAAKGQDTILGGGLSDYIIYIGVPACGLLLLIFLIVCIVCIRRRKAKKTSTPTKNRVPDLWVNSRTDLPMTSQNNVPEPSVVESVIPDQDIGCTSYEAVFDFKAEQSTHLSLKQGDHVRVNRKETAGWWRGTVGDQTGWFPSNYVQPALQDNIKTENEIQMHDDSHISSFMVKSLHDSTPRQSYILAEPNHRKSTPTEEEIEAEPIYCKIQPKDKRKSCSDRSNSTTPTKSQDTACADVEISYVALYPFVARVHGELTVSKGDIILCRETHGKNGWMKGKNDNTQQEGYVPTTYIKKIEPPVKTEEETPDKVDKLSTLDADPYSYKQLEVNTEDRQDLVGIVHKAIHTFTGEKAGDLEFDAGDLITVFQVLENGWWLGCKEKTVGWFPGTYVEMLDHPSSSPSPASSIQSPSESPVPSDDNIILNEDTVRTSSVSEPRPKLKPVRKAPPPPTRNDEPAVLEVTETDMVKKPESKLPRPGGSKLPKMSRPKVAPPQPPSRSPDDSPLYDVIDKSDKDNHSVGVVPNDSEVKNNNVEVYEPGSDGLYDLIKDPVNHSTPVSTPGKPDKVKPPVPKRYIKPKLVTVPRTDVQLPDKDSVTKGLVNGDIMRLRSPPPPRPVAPKLGPIRAKLSAPKPLEDQIPNEEDNTYFHVTPQRKFDTFIRQESGEQELETENPYKALSSFGSSFGSTFGKPAQNKQDNYSDIQENGTEISSPQKVEYSPDNVAVLPVSAQVHMNGEMTENIHVSNNNEVISIKGDNKSKEDVNFDKHVVESPKDESESEFKPKSSIPITPKSKGSRLQAPKTVLNKDNSKDIVDKPECSVDVDKTSTESPIDKTTKLPKSKIAITPKENPRNKPGESNVFQYPDMTNNQSAPKLVNEPSVDNRIDNHDNNNDSAIKHVSPDVDDLRPRSESIGKPPVAPKPKSGLPKPKSFGKKDENVGQSPAITKKSPSFDENLGNEESKLPDTPKVNNPVTGLPVSKTRVSSESESEADRSFDETTKPATPVSKIPMGSAIPHQSPGLRGRKSNLPSPGTRTQSTERSEQGKGNRKKTNSECESPVSPVGNLRQKPESPAAGRKGSPLQNVTGEQRSLRNRSNSPANRTGIPTTVRNRSNSPAPKSPIIPVPKTNSPKLTPKNKSRGLVPPKKIHNGQDTATPVVQPETNRPSELPGLNSQPPPDTDSTDDSLSPKPDRPSKPPRVQKKKSPDGKPPKGKSLLPVIHKSMESGGSPSNGVASPSGGTKPRRGIPVAKPNRPPAPKSPPAVDSSGSVKKTLYQAMRAYTAQNDGELSFSEGTFVKELSDCDRAGWFVGMLADGTTGLYPADYFKPSPLSAQSEA